MVRVTFCIKLSVYFKIHFRVLGYQPFKGLSRHPSVLHTGQKCQAEFVNNTMNFLWIFTWALQQR